MSWKARDPRHCQINIRFKLVTLFHAGVTPDGANIDHAIAELNKSTTLSRQFDIGNVAKAEVGQGLVLVLPEPLDEAVALERLAETPCDETVLREAKIKETGHLGSSIAQLLLLLHIVGTADLADCRPIRFRGDFGEYYGKTEKRT